MELKGYALISITANSVMCENLTEFQGKPCRIMEINKQLKSALVLSPNGTEIACFEFSDVVSMFECGEWNNIITPPNLDAYQRMIYATSVMQYEENQMRDMKAVSIFVIAKSLHYNTFKDDLYFSFLENK